MYFNLVLQYTVFILFFVINGFSQSNKNFLIVENPFELKIYNKYEQNLSPVDSSYLQPFCPIEIIDGKTLLSDNYTPAFIGKIENQSFYFLKPEKNLPLNKLFTSYSKQYKNVQGLMDTIQIVMDNKIVLYNEMDKNQRQTLVPDTKLFRIFRKGTKTYVKILSELPIYGWCELSNKNTWIYYHSPTKKKNEDIADVESVIKNKLVETNSVIKKLFNHFNHLNRVQVQYPYWTYLIKENEFVCTMLNNENNYDFTESTNILINELQLSLSHTSYKVLWYSNEILVQKTR